MTAKDKGEQVADFKGRLSSLTGSLKNLLLEFDTTRLHKGSKELLKHERKCIEAALKELVRPKPLSRSDREILLVEEWNQK